MKIIYIQQITACWKSLIISKIKKLKEHFTNIILPTKKKMLLDYLFITINLKQFTQKNKLIFATENNLKYSKMNFAVKRQFAL